MVNRGLLAGLAALGLAVGAGCSPYGGGAFACSDDTQCGAGVCKAGFCAFDDASCASGLRYGQLSGPLANACVAAADDAGAGDASGGADGSAAPDAPPGDACYGANLVHACFAQMPSGTRTFPADTTIATDDPDPDICDPVDNASAWCVIAAATIRIDPGVTLRATGVRPLVLLATDTITVSGTLDVASHRTPAESIGAAADPASCAAGTPPTTNSGGAGGSFGGAGGKGALGAGGTPGTPGDADANPTSVRGGCPGQDGTGGNTIARAGHGGGAVYLLAGNAITVGGSIDASGEGSTVGTPSNGAGGGGGAGGMIGLDAPTVTVTGLVFANGGGGSSGTGGSTGGSSGGDPTGVAAAPGGNGPTTHGGRGGNGAAGATLTGADGGPGNSGGGGGGGGGGAGVIVVFPPQALGGQVSPPPA